MNDLIYVIGGRSQQALSLATVERYNPTSRLFAWFTEAPMPQPRSWPSGAATINGKIYVTGGLATNSARTRSLFVYNPATNTWTTKTQIPVPTAQGASAVRAVTRTGWPGSIQVGPRFGEVVQQRRALGGQQVVAGLDALIERVKDLLDDFGASRVGVLSAQLWMVDRRQQARAGLVAIGVGGGLVHRLTH